MRIGIDLDNTIIDYDGAFRAAAEARGLIAQGFAGGKQYLRDHIRGLPDGEKKWQALQGEVYGKGIGQARLFPGVREFIEQSLKLGHTLFIVSHKTEFGHYDADRVNLRDAAMGFLAAQGLGHVPISFHTTRQEKVEKIAALGLDWFIDDLVEVYEEAHFPIATQKILFHPSPAPEGHWQNFASWYGITATLLLPAVASKLAGATSLVEPAASGGNSRVYKVSANDKNYALKHYPADRNRLATERQALQLMRSHGIVSVPEWIAGAEPYGLMSWVEGNLITAPNTKDIDEAAGFLAALYNLNKTPEATELPLAAEACLSGQSIIGQIEKRLAVLNKHTDENPALEKFLSQQFLPTYRVHLSAAQKYPGFSDMLPQENRTLIAADFGFHNILRNTNGVLTFIDFEYFGWDDPAKLMADFLLHPATPLPTDLRKRFHTHMTALYGDAVAARFAAYYPLFGLRWALILLNEFIPERWQARQNRGNASWDEVKNIQLQKAQHMLNISEKFE